MNWVKNIPAKFYGWFIALAALLAFLWERKEDIADEAKLLTASDDKKDAVLATQQTTVEQTITTTKAETKQAEEQATTLTPAEIAKATSNI